MAMNTNIPDYFYHRYHDDYVRIVFKDGREWVGMVTGLAGDKTEEENRDEKAIIFTRIKYLKGYYKKIPFFRGRRRRLSIGEIAEIHELAQPKWTQNYRYR
jgi:hypothetical protein